MRQLNTNIWVAERDFKLAGLELGNRMTIIKLSTGGLLLHSPVEFTSDLGKEIDALGSVEYIITPNNFHGLFTPIWCDAFPKAKHYSAKTPIGNSVTIALGEELQNHIAEDIRIIKIDGIPKLNEFAFIHLKSSTLILTDIAFNIQQVRGWWSRFFFRLNGAWGKFGPSRVMKTMIEDPQALRSSIEKMMAYNLNKIVVSHGSIVEENAKAILDQAFQPIAESKNSRYKRSSGLSPARCG